MEKLLVILNPWAGRGTAGRRQPELEQALRETGVDFAIVNTHAVGGAIELAWQGVERGYGRIVAVGGDGTINEVVNGIKGAEASLGRRARLGVIPLGTGSDFIKALDGVEANDIHGGVRRAVGERVRAVDLGRVRVGDSTPRFFINALGIGLDAQVAAESLKLTKLKGLAVYLVAIIRALANYKAHPMTVEYDGNRVHRRLLFASSANGRCQGGGFWMTEKPTELCPNQMVCVWQNSIMTVPDTTRGGQPLVGLAGRVYFFGEQLDFPKLCSGALGVSVIDESSDEVRRSAWLADRHVHTQEPCRNCWARYMCGGGCHHEVISRGRPACDYIRGWLHYCLDAYLRLSPAGLGEDRRTPAEVS